MKCHYEVLGVPRDVDSEELKKNYRKLALQWHPDKNPDCILEATEQFRRIQQAYETLSDSRERSWYDAHRESIIRGGTQQSDDSLDIFCYFNTSCYDGFDDSPKGFYTVYREVFEQISAEDKSYMDAEDASQIPSFGSSDSSYEEVVSRFYGYWQSYCTAKSFTWLDEYDLRQAPHRKVAKLMEKENKKIRDEAKKERNEQIRTLVEFVRKRDRRRKMYRKLLEEKSQERARKLEENRQKHLLERQRTLENYKENDWASTSQLEQHLQQLEITLVHEFGEEYEKDEDDESLLNLYCVACDKGFKNDKTFTNHKNSKKHKENVALLRATLQEEDIEFSNGELDELNECNGSTVEESSPKNRKKSKKKASSFATSIQEENEVIEVQEVVQEAPTTTDTKLKGKKAKDARRKTREQKGNIVENPAVFNQACSVCNEEFPSRNKLFEHLQSAGHKIYVPTATRTSLPKVAPGKVHKTKRN